MSLRITAFDKLSFEDAVRIIYFHFSDQPKIFVERLEDVIACAERPNEAVTKRWYDEYRTYHQENQEGK